MPKLIYIECTCSQGCDMCAGSGYTVKIDPSSLHDDAGKIPDKNRGAMPWFMWIVIPFMIIGTWIKDLFGGGKDA